MQFTEERASSVRSKGIGAGASNIMPSLNLDVDYLEHPKVMLLSEALGEWAEFLPVRLWLYAAKFHAETGEIKGDSVRLIERHLKWRGKKGKGIEALIKYGFLEPIEDGFRIHEFTDHQGHLVAYKIRGRIAAETRWARTRGDATSMQQAYDKDAASNAPTNGANGANGAERPPPQKSQKRKTRADIVAQKIAEAEP